MFQRRRSAAPGHQQSVWAANAAAAAQPCRRHPLASAANPAAMNDAGIVEMARLLLPYLQRLPGIMGTEFGRFGASGAADGLLTLLGWEERGSGPLSAAVVRCATMLQSPVVHAWAELAVTWMLPYNPSAPPSVRVQCPRAAC